LVLGFWAIPLAVGLVAQLGDWSRPAMASAKAAPELKTPAIDKAA
jgi:hypothetical protein